MKPFNLEKALAGDPVVTRDGKTVSEIVHLKTVPASQCIIFVIDGRAHECSESGKFYFDQDVESVNDLFMAPKIVMREGWINIYPNSKVGYYMHPTKMAADCIAEENRVACVKVEWREEIL